jgi:hypothetical protein
MCRKNSSTPKPAPTATGKSVENTLNALQERAQAPLLRQGIRVLPDSWPAGGCGHGPCQRGASCAEAGCTALSSPHSAAT